MDYLLVGQRIQQVRKSKKLKQLDLAKKVGVSDRYISNIETGKDKCSLVTLLHLANALNVSMDYLLGENLNVNRIDEDYDAIVLAAKNLSKEQRAYALKFMQFLRQKDDAIE